MVIYFHESCRVRSRTTWFGRVTWQFEGLDKVQDEQGKTAERWVTWPETMTTAELEAYLLRGGESRDDRNFREIQTVGLRVA